MEVWQESFEEFWMVVGIWPDGRRNVYPIACETWAEADRLKERLLSQRPTEMTVGIELFRTENGYKRLQVQWSVLDRTGEYIVTVRAWNEELSAWDDYRLGGQFATEREARDDARIVTRRLKKGGIRIGDIWLGFHAPLDPGNIRRG